MFVPGLLKVQIGIRASASGAGSPGSNRSRHPTEIMRFCDPARTYLHEFDELLDWLKETSCRTGFPLDASFESNWKLPGPRRENSLSSVMRERSPAGHRMF